MKFIHTLYLDNNKLRNLDKTLSHLVPFSFLKNLNLCGNPVAEEPEYRNRVIYSLPSLDIFDRHSKIFFYIIRDYNRGKD
jgi:Leucine-rich repeat (LRR) protein